LLSNTYNIKDFTKTELFNAPTVSINGQLDFKNRTLTARYNGKTFIFIADNTKAALNRLVFYARNSQAINKSEESDLYSLVYDLFEGGKPS
jgi:hypothetical protein